MENLQTKSINQPLQKDDSICFYKKPIFAIDRHPDAKHCSDESVAAIVSSSYVNVTENVFLKGANGLLSNQEYMICECKYVPGVDESTQACGPNSNCINRQLFIECMSGSCPSGEYCQNKKFVKREYAQIEAFQTEKKGIGLRAKTFIPSDTFIIEYCGEALSKEHFKKRFKKHVKDNCKNFYFMSLKYGEYLDASRRGNLSRYINHSCEPNCVLNKWIVGGQWRIGIFSLNEIQKNEEITFDYKIGRCGLKPQKCYCESNACKGYIGAFDSDDTLEANITSESDMSASSTNMDNEYDRKSIKHQTTNKRSVKPKKNAGLIRKYDEDDNFLTQKKQTGLKEKDDVLEVCRSLMCCMNEPEILQLHLNRILQTSSKELLRRFIWCHGLRILSNCLSLYISSNLDICHTALMVVSNLQISSRNLALILEPQVKALTRQHSHHLSTLASKILDSWSNLKNVYKIPLKSNALQDKAYNDDNELSILKENNSSLSVVNSITSIPKIPIPNSVKNVTALLPAKNTENGATFSINGLNFNTDYKYDQVSTLCDNADSKDNVFNGSNRQIISNVAHNHVNTIPSNAVNCNRSDSYKNNRIVNAQKYNDQESNVHSLPNEHITSLNNVNPPPRRAPSHWWPSQYANSRQHLPHAHNEIHRPKNLDPDFNQGVGRINSYPHCTPEIYYQRSYDYSHHNYVGTQYQKINNGNYPRSNENPYSPYPGTYYQRYINKGFPHPFYQQQNEIGCLPYLGKYRQRNESCSDELEIAHQQKNTNDVTSSGCTSIVLDNLLNTNNGNPVNDFHNNKYHIPTITTPFNQKIPGQYHHEPYRDYNLVEQPHNVCLDSAKSQNNLKPPQAKVSPSTPDLANSLSLPPPCQRSASSRDEVSSFSPDAYNSSLNTKSEVRTTVGLHIPKALKANFSEYIIKQLSKVKQNFSPKSFKSTARSITKALINKELRARNNRKFITQDLPNYIPNSVKANIRKYMSDYLHRRGIDTTPIRGVIVVKSQNLNN